MSNWAPLFEEIDESSLNQEPLHVRWAFMIILSKKNHRTHVARMNVRRLAKAANITVEQAEDAFRILSSPDPNSLSEQHEGRRLLVVADGWYVVTGPEYNRRMRELRAKELHAEAQQKYRNKHGSNGSVPHGTRNPENSGEWIEYCISLGITEKTADEAFDHYRDAKWMIAGEPIRDWKAVARTIAKDQIPEAAAVAAPRVDGRPAVEVPKAKKPKNPYSHHPDYLACAHLFWHLDGPEPKREDFHPNPDQDGLFEATLSCFRQKREERAAR